jgi:hypothetical protein
MSKSPGRDFVVKDIDEAIALADDSKAETVSPLIESDRITGQFILHKETCDDKPITARAQFCSLLKSKGIQPYNRKIKVGKEWIPLDLGWVPLEGAVGFVIIDYFLAKEAPSIMMRLQNKKLGSDDKLKPLPSLLVSITGNRERVDFEIEAGHCNVYNPNYPSDWLIKSSTDDSLQISLTVFPR